MKCICVILLLCTSKGAHTAGPPKVVGPDGPVLGVVGDDLILPCYLKDSANAMDMDVQWLIEHSSKVVHHYKNFRDHLDNQLAAYRNRTSLSRDGLQSGNLSLKLTSVRLSDTCNYRCFVLAKEGYGDASVEVEVVEPGSEPEVTAVSHWNGSVTLVCVSTNWLFPPAMEWRDGMGMILQNVSTMINSHKTSFNIQQNVTVDEQHGHNYTCTVSKKNYRTEKTFMVDRKLFGYTRHHWSDLVVILILLSTCIYLVVRWGILRFKGRLSNFKVQVKRDYETFLGEREHQHSCYIMPRIINRIVDADDQLIYKTISLEDIFGSGDGYPETESIPKVIVLLGRSGYGKSCTSQRIVYDWASGAKLKQFDLVLLLKSEGLNRKMKTMRELVEFVCHERFHISIKRTLKKSSDKVLFILDGFDELVFSRKKPSLDLISPFRKASVEDHLLALLSGRIMSASSLIVTTRPSALGKLKKLIQPRPIYHTQILGFSKDNVKEYFDQFFKSTDKSPYSDVQTNKTLSASCCIPGMCYLICSVLKSEYETSNMTQLETVTSIFLEIVKSFMKQHNGHGSLDHYLVKELVLLAKEGILTKNNLKSIKDLSLKANPFIFRDPSLNECKFKQQVFQEFFTALSYIIPNGLETVKTVINDLNGDSLNQITHKFAEIRFMFGLSNHTVSIPNIVDKDWEDLVQTSLKPWICKEMAEKQSRYVRLFLLRCLFELHNEDVVKEAMRNTHTIDLNFTILNEVDCLVLQYCLQCYPDIRCLKLRKCHLTAAELKLLIPVLGKLQELRLDVEDLANDDIKDLISALPVGECLAEESEPQVIIRLSAVKSLSSETAAELLKTLLHSKKNSSVSIEVAEESNGPPCVCSSISVNKDKDSFEVLVLCGTQQSGNGPAVSLMSLTMAPTKAFSPDWADIMEQLGSGTSSSQKNAITQLQECLCKISYLTKARFIVNDLIQDGAREMFSQLTKKCCKLMDFRLQACRKGGKSISFSLSKVKPRIDCLQVTGYSTSEISLTLSDRPESSKLSDLLNKMNSLEDAAEDLDEKMAALLSSVNSLDFVMDMTLRVKCLTKSWADGVIKLIQKCSSLQDVKLTSVKQKCQDNVCSSLSLKKVDNGHVRVIALCSSGISNVSLILPLKEALECSDVFRQINTEIESELDNAVQTLLCMPGLEYVELNVRCLTEISAERILSSISGTNDRDKIKVDIYSDSDDAGNLCSLITVEKEGSKFSLTANNWMVSTTSYTAPALSHISVLSENHETHSANSIKLLKMFHALETLTDSDPDVDRRLCDLMESLYSLHGLEEVKLKVNSLTESWAERIINLIQRCTTLKNVRLSAGLNTVAGDVTGWLEHGTLQDDGIKLLRESRRNMSCNITVSGISPSMQKGKRRRPVEIKI